MKKMRTVGGRTASFLKESFPNVKRKDVLLWAAIIAVATVLATVLALLSFRWSFGLGDVSTFFQFAHDLAHGQAIYKDFIHFRTPGSYFLNALSIRTFGDHASSVTFSLQLEAHTWYILIFSIGLAIFLGFKRHMLGAIVLAITLVLPAYLQLRIALGFLAVVLYIQARRVVRYRSIWLLLSGIAAGLTFTFGQDVAAMVVATIVVAELCTLEKPAWLSTLKNLSIVAGGSLIGILPLLSYVLLASNFGNFLYYTIYYSFVLQPKAMDLPFPVFGYENFLYYLIPAILVLCFYIFYSAKKVDSTIAVILVFAVMRLATLFGRSDSGHLIFVLPEVFLVSALSLTAIFHTNFSKTSFQQFLPFGISLVLSLYLAITISSSFVVLGGFVILLGFRFRKQPRETSQLSNSGGIILIVFTTAIAIMGYLVYPGIATSIASMSTRGVMPESVGGTNVSKEIFNEVNSIRAAVLPYHPTTIFSFPIQPYYYTLAPKQATRFVTFEAETTDSEQDQAVSDLERTRPEVVVMDPAQAAQLSKSVWKISNYVTSHYQVSKVVTSDRVLWVMTPDVGRVHNKLVFSIYRFNDTASNVVHDVQSPDLGANNGVLVYPQKSANFTVGSEGKNKVLQFSIFQNKKDLLADCATVYIADQPTKVCSSDGMVRLPVRDADKITIQNDDSVKVILNNAEFVD